MIAVRPRPSSTHAESPSLRTSIALLSSSLVAPSTYPRTLAAYDMWIGLLQDKEFRQELLTLTEATRDASPLFQDIRRIGRQLDRGLLALLFDTQLGGMTWSFGIL